MTQTTYRSVFAALVRHLFHITESAHPGPDRLRSRPLFALDELANLARIEDLPEVLSTIRTCAQVIVGIQEISQLVSGWGRDKATTVVGNLPTRVILPGSSDASALRCWADLSGDDDNYALNTWRTINTGTARILAGNRDPFETRLSRPKRWMPTIDPPTPIPPPPQPEPQQPAPCTGSDDGSPVPTTTRRQRRPPADQPSLFALRPPTTPTRNRSTFTRSNPTPTGTTLTRPTQTPRSTFTRSSPKRSTLTRSNQTPSPARRQ